MSEDVKRKIFLKLFYSFQDWEWYKEPNTCLVFIHLLLLANRKDKKYKNDTIHRGEVLASFEFLAADTGLSVRNVRTAIKNLKVTHDVTHRLIGKTSVYMVSAYDKWQSSDKISDIEVTSKRHRSDIETTSK